MVVRGEALATKRRMKKEGRRPDFEPPAADRNPLPLRGPFHPAEVAHQVFQAWLTFPVWDVARRAHLGVAPDDYARAIGELLAPMSEVAAANPYAWFPEAHLAEPRHADARQPPGGLPVHQARGRGHGHRPGRR